MVDNMPLDVFEYLTYLDQERYRAVILHAAPEKGTAVTQFARKVCAQAGGKYFDLLDWFIQHQELSAKIDGFGPEELRTLLKEQSKGTSLLFVDRADFILDTWHKTERNNFFGMVTDQWDGYKDGMKTKLLIALQTSPGIEALHILDSQGQTRVLRLSDFNDIL
jgi:hypothetical protein